MDSPRLSNPAGDDMRRHAEAAHRSAAKAARECIANAATLSLPNNAAASDVFASDESCRELYRCVHEFARALRWLGRTMDSIEQEAERLLDHAAAPARVHPALISAVRAWCREVTDDMA